CIAIPLLEGSTKSGKPGRGPRPGRASSWMSRKYRSRPWSSVRGPSPCISRSLACDRPFGRFPGQSFDDDARAGELTPGLVQAAHASTVGPEFGAIPPAPAGAVAQDTERTDRFLRRVREHLEDHLAAVFLARRDDECLAAFIDQEEPRWEPHVAERDLARLLV